MDELVPFQAKRKKTFPAGTTRKAAVKMEFSKHFTKNYPQFSFGTTEVSSAHGVTTLGQQPQAQDPTLESVLALYVNTTETQTLANLESIMLVLRSLARQLAIKRPYQVLPKPYQKQLKHLYTAQETLDQLTEELKSKRRAKRYLRILQKRMGFYAKKKPPFKKARR